MHFSANLKTPNLQVDVCDEVNGCFLCDGREERIKLNGLPGWNFIMCEQIGSSVKIVSTNGSAIGICEIEILAQNGTYHSNSQNNVRLAAVNSGEKILFTAYFSPESFS